MCLERNEKMTKSKLSSKTAKVIGDKIAEIEKQRGRCTPRALVDAARPKSSPIHKYFFKWTDREAAEKWRIEQAKFYLRTIPIYIEEMKITVRRFMTEKGARGSKPRGYISTIRILNSKQRMKNMLEIALEELKSFQKKYAILTELCDRVDEVIESMKRKV